MAYNNSPKVTYYTQNFTIEMLKNKDTLNLFSDASMRKLNANNTASCYGSVAVHGDTIVDELYRVNSSCTVPAAEIRGIRCSLSLALKYRYNFKVINIFSDSQVALFCLRDYVYNWHFNPLKEVYVSNNGNKVVKNQDILVECFAMLQELRKTNIVNLFHQSGHVDSTMASIKKALLTFKEANGVKGIVGYDVIRYISLYNNYVDNKSRSFIRTTNVYDNNYRDAISMIPTKNSFNTNNYNKK